MRAHRIALLGAIVFAAFLACREQHGVSDGGPAPAPPVATSPAPPPSSGTTAPASSSPPPGNGGFDAGIEASALPPPPEEEEGAHVRFVGRFDTHDPAHPWCAWPGCRIVARFDGTQVTVRLNEHVDGWMQGGP